MREKVLGRPWQYPLFGQLVRIWKGLDKDQAHGYLLDIDIWQSGATRVMLDGIVIKGLAPKQLDPINPQTDLDKLEQGMPWRTIKDEFGKFKRITHEARVYQGSPFAVEPDATTKVFIASMMHAHKQHPTLSEKPDVTCPSDVQNNPPCKEVVHHEEVPGYS